MHSYSLSIVKVLSPFGLCLIVFYIWVILFAFVFVLVFVFEFRHSDNRFILSIKCNVFHYYKRNEMKFCRFKLFIFPSANENIIAFQNK